MYHNKLVNIRKEMIMLHEKTTKLKVRFSSQSVDDAPGHTLDGRDLTLTCCSLSQKRALKLQQQKQKEALEKEQQREKELERERQLTAKPAKKT